MHPLFLLYRAARSESQFGQCGTEQQELRRLRSILELVRPRQKADSVVAASCGAGQSEHFGDVEVLRVAGIAPDTAAPTQMSRAMAPLPPCASATSFTDETTPQMFWLSATVKAIVIGYGSVDAIEAPLLAASSIPFP